MDYDRTTVHEHSSFLSDALFLPCTCRDDCAFIMQGNYGAVTSGLPDTDECSSDLEVDGCEFSGCQAYAFGGKGGSLSIFDTTASVSDTIFENSQGTAMLFESSTGDHFLDVST